MKITDYHIITARIDKLKHWLKDNDCAACIIPQADPHQSEYIEDHYKVREFFSGFDGSAGTLAVTADEAALWTDSRYFIQAALQTEGSGIEICKQGLPGTPSIKDWLSTHAKNGKIAANAECFSHKSWEELSVAVPLCDMPGFENLWESRPAKSGSQAYIHDVKYCGESSACKLERIRRQMEECGISHLIVSDLDDVAWLTNLRAADVAYNPVLRAYVTVGHDYCHLFTDKGKTGRLVENYLLSQGIDVRDYDTLKKDLSDMKGTVACDFSKLCQSVFAAISQDAAVSDFPLFVARMRAVKNSVEIDGYRRAMERDGVVWVKFLRWFEENKKNGTKFSETAVAGKLYGLKKEQDLFVDESFGTIAGYGPHGAIGHYNASPESDCEIGNRGFLVIDTGTHYLDGTTDMTRTLNCGKSSDTSKEEKIDYTLVLKGHIALAKAVFPEGTKGCQLDILARQFLWNNLEDYGHGTGHGVGHLLNVHEGYAWLRPRDNGEGYKAGLTMTDEPGIYKEGKYGIRIENTLLVTDAGQSGFGKFLKFESLTLCPYDLSAVDPSMISREEAAWIREYHKQVSERLAARLSDDDKRWLDGYITEQEKHLTE